MKGTKFAYVTAANGMVAKNPNGKPAGVRAYEAEMLIRNASNGKKYLYDIVHIEENTAVVSDLVKRQTRLAAYAAAQQGASVSSIPNADEKSNTQSQENFGGKTSREAAS